MSGPSTVHMADSLSELTCRVSFLEAALWAIAALDDCNTVHDSTTWQGLAYYVSDVQSQLRVLARAATPGA